MHTIPNIELIPHDRKPHWVTTKQQVTVFNRRVEGDVVGDTICTTAVPASAMKYFGRGCHVPALSVRGLLRAHG
jgi:hypothetical protein